MGVLNGSWWSVWWPWMLVWLVTMAGLAAVLTLGVRAVQRSRRPNLAIATSCFYLDNQAVKDLFQSASFAAVLRSEVEERISKGAEVGVSADLLGLAAVEGRRQSNWEVVRTYLEEAEPISMIGVVLAALEREGVVVHADLARQTLRRSRALTRALETAYGPDRVPQSVPLADIDAFVLVRGRFRKTGESAETIAFEAPYGDPAVNPDPGSVRIACQSSGLRNDVPGGAFVARCLGKVGQWNADEGVLEVDAVAVFR